MSTTKNSATRDKLIDTGARLFGQQGYNATGINAVLNGCGVPKGSFYHYFASKELFGLAVIECFAAHYEKNMIAQLDDTTRPPLERLECYFAAGRADMQKCDHTQGCLIGNLGQELSGQSDSFRDALDDVFKRWEGHFVTCLAAARDSGDIADDLDLDDLASFILAGWQGAMLRAKTLKSVRPMEQFERLLFQRVLASP